MFCVDFTKLKPECLEKDIEECGLTDETLVFKQKSSFSNFPVILVLILPCLVFHALCFANLCLVSCVCLFYPRNVRVTLPPL